MDYSELCRLKDKLLHDVRKNTDLDESYIEGMEEGIMRFFTKAVIELIETDDKAA